MSRIFKKGVVAMLMGVMLCSNIVTTSAMPIEAKTYDKVNEIFDWGAATTKVIINVNQTIEQDMIDEDTFSVHVSRRDPRKGDEALLEQGERNILDAYVSDKDGNKVKRCSYVTLELEVGPNITLGSPLNYYSGSNVWIECDYTIKQEQPIQTTQGKIENLVYTSLEDTIIIGVDEFKSDSHAYVDNMFGDITMNYAYYEPAEDEVKNPLIIWLHGGGEGGTDTTIPLAANKATHFASDEIQNYFDGAYVLVPQSPTKWMDSGEEGKVSGATKTNATSKYTKALKSLIDEYIDQNSDIDQQRIYIGGASNGGFMTMRMIMDYPEYFAAAFPVCEGVKDEFVTDKDIEKIKDLPIWFICAATDKTLPAPIYTLPTYDRLIKAGSEDVHLSYFKNVQDTSGLYLQEDGTPYEYDGHWSWIYAYNNEVSTVINGESTTLMEWMAMQSK